MKDHTRTLVPNILIPDYSCQNLPNTQNTHTICTKHTENIHTNTQNINTGIMLEKAFLTHTRAVLTSIKSTHLDVHLEVHYMSSYGQLVN